MSRATQIKLVHEDARHEWLAGEIDILERETLDAMSKLTLALESLTSKLEEVREQAIRDRLAANWRTIGMMATIITALVVFLITSGLL